MAEDLGMGFEEYIQPYVDLANKLGLTIEVNDYDMILQKMYAKLIMIIIYL